MNIAVCLKQTPDTTTRVHLADDGTSIVEDDIQWIINPYDESAVEVAIQLTEQHGGEVTLVSLGPERVEEAIRAALAMGAHRAIRLDSAHVPVDPRVTAKALAAVLQEGAYDLIFTGQQAIDDDHAQVPQRIAQAMNLPCVTAIEELHIEDGQGWGRRVLEGVREKVSFRLPAVVGVNRRLVEPRYPSFIGIKRARQKPLEVRPAVLDADHLVITRLSSPAEKTAGRRFTDGVDAVPEVVRLLHEEAKVI